MVKKAVNVRLDVAILEEFDKLPGTRTENLEAAMEMYLQRKGNVDQRKDCVDTLLQLELELRTKDELLAAKNAHIVDLEVQLGWFHQYALPSSQDKRENETTGKSEKIRKWIKKKIYRD